MFLINRSCPAYRHFIEQGVNQGRREDLRGGSLVRNGRDKASLTGKKEVDVKTSDKRILGSGDFVVRVLKEIEGLEERRMRYRISFDELMDLVCQRFRIGIKDLVSPIRKRKISEARSVICYLAVYELGYKGIEVSKKLGISGKGVSVCVERGKRLFDNPNVKKGCLELLH